jgi:hypothetical protein
MDKNSAIAEAIQRVVDAVSEADGREMVGRRAPPPGAEMETEAPPECEACNMGECSDPDHASEDDLSAMMEG